MFRGASPRRDTKKVIWSGKEEMILRRNSIVRPPSGAPRRPLPPALAANLWKPGQSGNPSGHSGEYGEVIKLARAHTVRAVERLAELMESDDERVATVACQAILDRAYGKARANAEKEPSLEDKIAALSPEERRARLVELLNKARQTLSQNNVHTVIEVTEVEG
jgi:hypothetical protein